MKNIFLLLKNINNYGIFTFCKIVFYELINSIIFKDFKSLKYEQKKFDSYNLTKHSKIYNTPYIPTPYYFLSLIRNYFIKIKISKILFIDLGCGYSRTQFFFSKSFDSYFIGYDYNDNIINYLKNKKINRAKFYSSNLREKSTVKSLITNINKYKNRNLLVFFSDSFDLYLLNEILINISKKCNFYCILINIKKNNLLKIKYKTVFNKSFKMKNRNIKIIKIDVQR